MNKSIAILLCAVALTSCKNEPTEFVCYEDGMLTERHVGVVDARITSTVWIVTYVEGTNAIYIPHRGEACGLERVR